MSKLKEILLKYDTLPNTLGTTLKVYRKSLNLTLKQVEEITGIPYSNLSAIENDKMDLGLKRAELLAASYGLHPKDILFPSDRWIKSKKIQKIEAKAKKILSKVV